jgi:three-Cys-motif partner protein
MCECSVTLRDKNEVSHYVTVKADSLFEAAALAVAEFRKCGVLSEMVKQFASVKLVPTLFFLDPWGYKGLSLQIVNAVLKDWGCDCIFFFNYNRINMGLTNPAVQEHMNALFGEKRADQLRTELEGFPSRRSQLGR